MRERHIDTVHGWVGYERYRYECSECGKSYYPADRELELSEESRMSPKKEDELARLSVRMPYEEARKTYEELRGLPASRSVIHRVVQEQGKRVKERIKEVKHKPIKGAGREQVGADGTMVNMREEGWKEIKIGAYYKTDEEREMTEARYVATSGSREIIGKQLYELAGKPSLEESREMGFISDGAEWLEEMRKEHFPGSVGILDYYHASGYVGTLGKVFYGEEKAREWIDKKLEQLRRGEIKDLEKSFRHMKPKTDEQREQLTVTLRYFQNHGHKMKYPLYKREGFHIGSGVIEAGCKHVIQTRFKRTGMRWSRKGVEHLLCLRVAYLNNDWDSVQDAQWN